MSADRCSICIDQDDRSDIQPHGRLRIRRLHDPAPLGTGRPAHPRRGDDLLRRRQEEALTDYVLVDSDGNGPRLFPDALRRASRRASVQAAAARLKTAARQGRHDPNHPVRIVGGRSLHSGRSRQPARQLHHGAAADHRHDRAHLGAYAGTITVSGRTPGQVQARSRTAYPTGRSSARRSSPSIEKRSSQVSVLGDVNAAARVSLTLPASAFLDVISRAGGISAPAEETSVTLQRAVERRRPCVQPARHLAQRQHLRLPERHDLREPRAPDVSRLRRVGPQTGRSTSRMPTSAGRRASERRAVSSIRAADPGQVFLYRMVDAETHTAWASRVAGKTGVTFPVIFRANMRDPSMLFLAQQFR